MSYVEFINNILNTRGRFNCGDNYCERHHIIPKCMGGSNDDDNLIDLLAHEHYMAHKLLALEHPDNDKLVYAWHMMAVAKKDERGYEIPDEDYDILREMHANASSSMMTDKWANDDFKNRLKAALNSDETKNKMKRAAKARVANGTSPVVDMWKDKDRLARISNAAAQCDLDGNIIRTFPSAHEAARETDICYSSIASCCAGKRKTAGGYIWKYI